MNVFRARIAMEKGICENKRIQWVDTIKYVCIVMIMMHHFETRTDVWTAFYEPFALEAFFFLSGYVYKAKKTFGDFLYTKFRQLFIPWLIFSVLDICLSYIVSFNEHNIVEELKWNFLQIRAKGDGMWFVAALFIAFIPFFFFIKKFESIPEKANSKNTKCLIAITVAWGLSFISILFTCLVPISFFPWNEASLPWHIEYIFQAMFYMVLGYLFKHYFEKNFDSLNTIKTRVMLLILYNAIVFVPFFEKIEMPMMADIMYQYATSIVGIIALIAITKTVNSNKYISFVGQNTLVYFALHGKVFRLIQILLKKYAAGIYAAVLNSTAASSIFCFAFSLVLSVILIVPTCIVNRIFPFILGREKR